MALKLLTGDQGGRVSQHARFRSERGRGADGNARVRSRVSSVARHGGADCQQDAAERDAAVQGGVRQLRCDAGECV